MKKNKEDMTPENMAESAPQEIPKQSFFSNKINILAIVAIVLLLVSFVFNLILALGKKEPKEQTENKQEEIKIEESDDANLLLSIHTIDKKVVDGDVTWLGVKVATDTQAFLLANYELWRIENGKKTLIDSLPDNRECGKNEWDLNEMHGINLLNVTSPCEAFETNTNIVYDSRGYIQLKMVHNTNEDHFTFDKSNRPPIEVALVTEGVCEGALTSSEVPKVLLKGIKISGYNIDKEFNLDKPEKVACGVGYGDYILNPLIENITFDDQKIEFNLENNRKVIISLEDPFNYPTVAFE